MFDKQFLTNLETSLNILECQQDNSVEDVYLRKNENLILISSYPFGKAAVVS